MFCLLWVQGTCKQSQPKEVLTSPEHNLDCQQEVSASLCLQGGQKRCGWTVVSQLYVNLFVSLGDVLPAGLQMVSANIFCERAETLCAMAKTRDRCLHLDGGAKETRGWRYLGLVLVVGRWAGVAAGTGSARRLAATSDVFGADGTVQRTVWDVGTAGGLSVTCFTFARFLKRTNFEVHKCNLWFALEGISHQTCIESGKQLQCKQESSEEMVITYTRHLFQTNWICPQDDTQNSGHHRWWRFHGDKATMETSWSHQTQRPSSMLSQNALWNKSEAHWSIELGLFLPVIFWNLRE